jgi:hypothetical protein
MGIVLNLSVRKKSLEIYGLYCLLCARPRVLALMLIEATSQSGKAYFWALSRNSRIGMDLIFNNYYESIQKMFRGKM